MRHNFYIYLFTCMVYFFCMGFPFAEADDSYSHSSSDCSPIAPTHFCGKIKENKFATQTDIVHVLSWEPSTDAEIVGYRIFQGDDLIKELSARQVRVAIHNRSEDKNYTYRLVAFNSSGKESKPLSITLGKKKKDCEKCPKFRLMNPDVNVASTGNFFSQKFTTNACLLHPKFTTKSPLPAGLTLSSDGTLSGTPTEVGKFPIVVTVIDANGCHQESRVYRLTVICGTITFTTANENPCNGQSNGSINFTTSGGMPPFVYSINDGATFQSSNVFANLAGGTYQLVVKDVNHCTASGTTALTEFPAITFSTTHSNSCNGQSNGSITFTVSGDTPPFIYSINGGATFQSSNIFTNLSAGTYQLVIEDANHCTASETTTLIELPAITFTLETFNPEEGCDGIITINASGGTGTFAYSINGGATFQTSNSFYNLCAGTYDIVVIDQVEVTIINGSITTNDPVQINRVVRHQFASTCTIPTTFPGITTDAFHYNAFTFTNTNNTSVCVSVEYSFSCSPPPAIIAYLNSFDPNNVSLNYLADDGIHSQPFSFNVPAGQSYVLVVTEDNPNDGCESYTLTVIMPSSNSCTKTGTVTLEGPAVPSPSNTI